MTESNPEAHPILDHMHVDSHAHRIKTSWFMYHKKWSCIGQALSTNLVLNQTKPPSLGSRVQWRESRIQTAAPSGGRSVSKMGSGLGRTPTLPPGTKSGGRHQLGRCISAIKCYQYSKHIKTWFLDGSNLVSKSPIFPFKGSKSVKLSKWRQICNCFPYSVPLV